MPEVFTFSCPKVKNSPDQMLVQGLGLEVSRLARNSTDWHRLLEICALTDTLILDEDGVYDPRHFNDRLLLGLKGTISEAELHVLLPVCWAASRVKRGVANYGNRCPSASNMMRRTASYLIQTSRFNNRSPRSSGSSSGSARRWES